MYKYKIVLANINNMGNLHTTQNTRALAYYSQRANRTESHLLWEAAFSLTGATIMPDPNNNNNNNKICVFLGPPSLESFWHPGMPPPHMAWDIEAYINPDGSSTLNLEHYPCHIYQTFKYQHFERPQDKQGQFYIVLTNQSTHETIMVRWSTFVRNFAPHEYALQPHAIVKDAWEHFNPDMNKTETDYRNYTEGVLIQSRTAVMQQQPYQTYGGGQQQPYSNYGGGQQQAYSNYYQPQQQGFGMQQPWRRD